MTRKPLVLDFGAGVAEPQPLAGNPDLRLPAAMAGPARTPPKDDDKDRLAKALRDNLKRRKAQARERAGAATGPEPAPAGKVSDQKS